MVLKKSDYFSTPFEGLASDYSMGALPYPVRVSAPIAVLEIRSYPSMVENLTMDKMLAFVMTEIAYLQRLRNGDAPKAQDVQNLEALFALEGKGRTIGKIIAEKLERIYKVKENKRLCT